MLFNWTRWLARKNSPARKPIRSRRRPSFSPRIEELETRLAPATLTVTNLNDNTTWSSGDGSLRGEIAAAASGDTIDFQAGLSGPITLNSTNGTLALTKNLTIDGPGASTITVSGGNAVQILSVAAAATVNISGLELTEGQDSAVGGGGAIDNLGTLYLSSCELDNNKASKGGNSTTLGGGGAIENNGYLAINGCTFLDNTATNFASYVTGDGGAIYNTGTLAVDSSNFSGNHAIDSNGAFGGYGSGGAIYTTGMLTLYSSGFSDNVADHEGGAVRGTMSSAFTVNGCSFTGNQANQNSGGGGAILIADASLSAPLNVTVVGSTFSDNSTNGDGGAILAFGGIKLTVALSSFSGNSAPFSSAGAGQGGAIAQETSSAPPTVAIADCTFSQNTAAASGGGIYESGNYSYPTGIIAGCTFATNTATASGGAAYVSYDSISFTNDTFTANSGLLGGGVYSYQGITHVGNSTITGNFATSASGSIIGAGAGVQGVFLYNSTVDANTDAGEEMDAKFSSSSGYNLIGTLPTSLKPYMNFTPASSDIIDPNNNPQLGSLTSNGGITQTMMPLAGSPAINAGDPSFTSPPYTDQRGNTRVVGGRIDIGAVESGASADTVVTLSAGAVPEATPGTAYAGYTFAATGGTTPYVYGITAGSLPPGMTLQGGGLLTGTPLASGTFTFTVTAVDNFGNIAAQDFTILSGVLPTVSLSDSGSSFSENGGSATITAVLNGASNQDVTIPLTFGGTATGSDYSASATSITISAGQITGSVILTGLDNASFGNSPQTVIVGLGTLTNGTPGSPTSVTATVDPPLALPTAEPPNGTLANSYSYTFGASGGDGNYSYSVSSGSLPNGLSLDSSTGVLSGTPTQDGNFSFTLQVQAGDSTPSSFPPAAQAYTLTVNPAVVLSPTGLAIGSLDNSYSQTITATGGAGGPYTFTTTDPLDGLHLSTGGILNGTPTGAGTFTVTVTATDSNAATGSRQYTLTVNPHIDLTVNTTDDTPAVSPANSPLDSAGNISLRSAIQFTNANKYRATIDFAAGLGSLITLTSALPQITSNLTIQGPGAGALAVSGNNLYQVFLPNATVVISGLTIEDGYGSFGGGISAGGNLTLTDDTISNCASTAFGGGLFINGGVLTLTNDLFEKDTSSAWGGAIDTNGGTQTITDVTITNCTAGAGGAIAINGSNMTLTDDTLAGNKASQGGATSRGGGTLNLIDDTLWNNNATNSGGAIYGGASSLVGVTMSGNSAGKTAGGIYGGAGSIYNSIIAGNSAKYNPDAQGTFTSQGNNLIGYVGSSIGWVASDLQNVADPGLGTLQDNGGPTQTIALLPGSPALAAGNIAGAPATDQRGFQRVVNNQIDIGAFENQSQLLTLTPPAANPSADIGIAASFNLGSFAESGSSGNLWTVTVNWGDGSADTVFSANSQGGLGTQGHTYATNANSPYTVTVTVSDTDNNFDQITFPVTVNPPIVVSPTSPTGLAIGTVGNDYSQTITATGGAGSTYTFTTADPLDGLTLGTDGTLSGSPMTDGTFTITITATDSLGETGSQQYTLTIDPAITLSPTSLPAAGRGDPYNQTITASGGAGTPYTFSTSSALDGLTLSSAGLLSGKPTALGNFPITVTATDSNGGTGSHAYTLSVVAPQQTIGVFDPSSGNWYLRNSNSSGAPNIGPFAYGAPGWIPVVGDWNGNGVTTIGVVDPSTETWYLRNFNSPGAPSYTPFQYGAPGWIPVAGDWTGSGHTGIGVFDPSSGTWYLRTEVGPGTPDAGQFQYGGSNWKPVVGDWNGNGKTTIGVVDPSSETWYLRNSNSGGAPDFSPFAYGAPGWSVAAGDWTGTGHSGIGVFDPYSGTWYLRKEDGGGGADAGIFAYGGSNWKPLAGDWDFPLLPQLAAGGEAQVPSGAAPLTEGQLQTEVQAALNLLASDGVNSALVARLGSLQFTVGNSPAGTLGLSDVATGAVEISADAASYGWFVDANPLSSVPANRMDLLTVVLHEMGHFDGWTELDPATHPDALMALTLGTGQRRTQDLDTVFAAGL